MWGSRKGPLRGTSISAYICRSELVDYPGGLGTSNHSGRNAIAAHVTGDVQFRVAELQQAHRASGWSVVLDLLVGTSHAIVDSCGRQTDLKQGEEEQMVD